MTEDPIERLRAEASRDDYTSMARLARALYAQGVRSREVLRQCYGVDFPEEFFAMAGERLARPRLMAHFTNQPWKLGVPANQGGPPPTAGDLTEPVERMIFARDPDLVPLMELIGSDELHYSVICYRLTEIRAGRTTIFGIKSEAGAGDEIVHRGESMLAVLHEHHTRLIQYHEWLQRQPWHFKFHVLEERAADAMRSRVARIEAIQRQVASYGTG